MSMFEESWEKYLRYNLVPKQFPREIQKERIKVVAKGQYLEFFGRNYNLLTCYTSLYSKPQLEEKLIDTIFLEIDGINILDALDKSFMLELQLAKRGLNFRKYFSGRRGFHYYLDFMPVKLQQPDWTIKEFVRMLQAEGVDQHVVGNLRQLVRVPYTMHQATGLFSFRVEGKFSIKDAIHPPLNEAGPVENDALSEALLFIDQKLADKQHDSILADSIEVDFFPPCIISCISELNLTRQLSHAGRLHLTSFLGLAGFSKETIINLYETSADDFKLRRTKAQVDAIVNGKMRCYSCRRAAAIGLCHLNDIRRCGWYPNILIKL